MGMVRFELNGISAFKDKGQNGDGRHYCIICAGEAIKREPLIPFLEGQMDATLAEFGKEMGAMLSCDQCGEVVGTYYPEDFWSEKKEPPAEDPSRLIFKKF
jgi:hypothetical protein